MIVAVVIMLIIAGFYSINASKADQSATAEVVSMNLTETAEASGSLEAQSFASLNWKTSGVVETVYVKTGQTVKAGDILLALQPESTSASIAAAQADLANAQQSLEDLTNSDSELAQAMIDLRDAEVDFHDKEVYWKYAQTNKKIPQTESRGWYELRDTVG